MIRIQQLGLSRGTKSLFSNATAVIHPGERVGLIGSNGAGKSTLFALLAGTIGPDLGDVDVPSAWRISSVAQDNVPSETSAIEHVIDGDGPLRRLEQMLAHVETEHAEDAPGAGEQLGELHEQLAQAGAYTARARAEALLFGLGFTQQQCTEPVSRLSGGWRMRLELGRALMAPSDLLLLDEPTNHLDLDAIVWLEQWLKRYPGTLVVVSHDREFLDSVCTAILAIDNQTLQRYSGNYSSYELQFAERRRQVQLAFERQQRDVAHLHRFIERFKAKASKARQAQSRVKALERMEMLAPVHADSPFSFRFREAQETADPMLVADDLVCGYRSAGQERPILHEVELAIRNGERIGLLGANGQGKSTLIKTLAGTLEPLSGTLTRARNLAIGYFAQQQVDMLRLDESPLHQIARVAPNTREQELRDYLGSFNFRGDAVHGRVELFSGGEKARLALALLIWQRPSLLLLDEPTNHLDLETRAALTVALAQFEGTVVLVSHDRSLLAATTDRLVLVAAARVREFEGDLDDYRNFLLGVSAPESVSAAAPVVGAGPKARRDTRPATGSAPRGQSGSRRKPIESRIARIEEQLTRLAARRAEIEALLAQGTTYDEAQREQLRAALVDQAYTAREIEKLEEQWLEQTNLLDQLQA